MESVFATSSWEMSIPSAISSTVGSRPSSWSSEAERLPMRCSVPARFSGTRTMRDCSASACRIACRIHHTAYEMNLIPLVSSNLWAARIRPRFPSLIRSDSETRSEEHTSELQSLTNLVCRLLLEKKKKNKEPSSRLSDSENISEDTLTLREACQRIPLRTH